MARGRATKAEVEIQIKLGKAIEQMTDLTERFDALAEKIDAAGEAGAEAGGKAGGALQSLISKFPLLGKAIVVANQGFQLMSSVVSGVFGAIKSTITGAFNFIMRGVEQIRRLNPFDPMIRSLDQLKDEAAVMQAAIARPFLAAFIQVKAALAPLANEIFNIFGGADVKKLTKSIKDAFLGIIIMLGTKLIPMIPSLILLMDKGFKMLGEGSLASINDRLDDTVDLMDDLRKGTKASLLSGALFTYKRGVDELTDAETERLAVLEGTRQKLLKMRTEAENTKGAGLGIDVDEMLQGVEKLRKAFAGWADDVAKGNAATMPDPPPPSWKLMEQAFDKMNPKLREFFKGLEDLTQTEASVAIKELETAISETTGALSMSMGAWHKVKQAFEPLHKILGITGQDLENLTQDLSAPAEKLARVQQFLSLVTQGVTGMRAALELLLGQRAFSKTTADLLIFMGALERLAHADKMLAPVQSAAKQVDDAFKQLGKMGLDLPDFDMDLFQKANPVDQVKMLEDALDSANGKIATASDLMVGMSNFAMAAGTAFGAYAAAVMEGGQAAQDAIGELGKAMLMTFIDVITQIIMADAARAAAGSASQIFGSIPMPWALPIAVAAAAVALGFVKGFVSMAVAKEGGHVYGGVSNRDSVPIMAMPGEYVMSVPEVKGVSKFFGNMGQVAYPTGSGLPSARPITIQINTQQLPDRMATKRWVKTSIRPALDSLARAGY